MVALFSGTCGSIEIIDDDGHLIKLENPAERIISLAPSLTELMFEIGAGDKYIIPFITKKIPSNCWSYHWCYI